MYEQHHQQKQNRRPNNTASKPNEENVNLHVTPPVDKVVSHTSAVAKTSSSTGARKPNVPSKINTGLNNRPAAAAGLATNSIFLLFAFF